MRVLILGRRWELRYVRLKHDFGDSDADAQNAKHKQIRISKGLSARREIDVVIHEVAHCGFPCFAEPYIDSFADVLGMKLIESGWKKNADGEKKNDDLYAVIKLQFLKSFPFVEHEWAVEFCHGLTRILLRLGWRKSDAG